MTATDKQIKYIHTLKRKNGLSDDEYRVILAQWGVDSSRGLDSKAAGQVIRCLTTPQPSKEKRNDPCDQLRKRLIAMSYSIGEDVKFVKGWAEKYGVKPPHGGERICKPFNDYTAQELMGLCEKFKKVIADRQRAVTGIR